MRVLHLIKTSIGARWALQQMKELVALGHDIHVATLPGGPLVQQYQSAGVHVHAMDLDFPMRQPWRWHKMMDNMRCVVADVQPDLIHSHFVSTTLTMRIALGKTHPIPRVFQVPSPLHLEYPLFSKGELFTAGDKDYWIASCRWTYNRYIHEGVSHDHIFMSYYGTDLEKFTIQNKGKLRAELGVDASTKLIGMVAYMYAPKIYLGQMRGLKGHEDLIDAIAMCLKTEPALRGVFIGGAWNGAAGYERQLRRYGQEKCGDHVAFMGTRSDVPELYPDLDVVVHPSHHENVGGAAESLLLGVPTITTDVGGFPDVVKQGETGWLVPPKNARQLADAMLEALHNLPLSREMALRGQALARTLFDVKRTSREISEFYLKILSLPALHPNAEQ